MELEQAARLLDVFARGALTPRLAGLEASFKGADSRRTARLCENEGLNGSLIEAALHLKSVAGQINVLIHAAGILAALPKILENSETVQSLSLGAGNTGRDFDLETDRRIAEFKFIRWRGGAESIRQNSLFKDFYSLAESTKRKERYLYVLGTTMPLKFLAGRRSLDSVMSKNTALQSAFRKRYGSQFVVVSEYYAFRRDRVKIVDLLPLVPQLGSLSDAVETIAEEAV
jgi:hypothetical protein